MRAWTVQPYYNVKMWYQWACKPHFLKSLNIFQYAYFLIRSILNSSNKQFFGKRLVLSNPNSNL
jgi:hypothetical protein